MSIVLLGYLKSYMVNSPKIKAGDSDLHTNWILLFLLDYGDLDLLLVSLFAFTQGNPEPDPVICSACAAHLTQAPLHRVIVLRPRSDASRHIRVSHYNSTYCRRCEQVQVRFTIVFLT